MESIKIVITGPYASGKTEFISSISEIEVVSTEAEVQQEDEKALKNHTTVALDFGKITINPEVALYLFGTPGQERFDFMWEILSIGCIGYIVMVDSTRPNQFREATNIINFFTQRLNVPFVVLANKQDDPTALPVDFVRYRLQLPDSVPVLPCVACDRESVKSALLHLLGMVYEYAE